MPGKIEHIFILYTLTAFCPHVDMRVKTANRGRSALQQLLWLLWDNNNATRATSMKKFDSNNIPFGAFRFPFQAQNFDQLKGNMTQEQILFHHLFRRYDRIVRPVLDVNTPVVVNVGMTLAQISDIDMKKQKMVALFWRDQDWIDHRLQWDPDSYFGIKTLHVPYHRVWTPDIVLYNNVGGSREQETPIENLASVEHNGNVFLAPVVLYHSYCRLDVTFFPFDRQFCWLKLGSWAHTGDVLDVNIRGEGIDTSNHMGNGEWELVAVKTVKNVKFYPCCPEPFPELFFYFHLKRRLLYYTFSVLAPCIIMSSVAMFTFFLPSECSEKVTLGLTVLLAYTVFQLTVTESLPQTSEFLAYISIYFTVVIITISLTVLASIIVVSVKEYGRLTGTYPPRLLLKIFAFFKLIPLQLIESTSVNTAAKVKKKLMKNCLGTKTNMLPVLQKAILLKKKPVVFEFHIRDEFNLLGPSHSRTCRIVQHHEDIFHKDVSLMDMDLLPTREELLDCFIKDRDDGKNEDDYLVNSHASNSRSRKHLTEIVLENRQVEHPNPRIRLLSHTDSQRSTKAFAPSRSYSFSDKDGVEEDVITGIKSKTLRREASRAAEEIRTGVEQTLHERLVEREWVAIYMGLDNLFFFLLSIVHVCNTFAFTFVLPVIVPIDNLDELVRRHLESMNTSYSTN